VSGTLSRFGWVGVFVDPRSVLSDALFSVASCCNSSLFTDSVRLPASAFGFWCWSAVLGEDRSLLGASLGMALLGGWFCFVWFFVEVVLEE